MAYTNGIEEFWALLQRGYQGIHITNMGTKHLGRGATELAGRYNARSTDTIDRMIDMTRSTIRKWLRYRDLAP